MAFDDVVFAIHILHQPNGLGLGFDGFIHLAENLRNERIQVESLMQMPADLVE